MGLFDFLKPDEEENQPEPELAPYKIENPDVQDYMTKYSAANRQKIVDEAKGPNFSAALAALGSGLQGGNAAETGANFIKNQQAMNEKKLAGFDAGKMLAEENDPMSPQSKLAQQAAKELGVNPEVINGLTAAKFKSQVPMWEKIYQAKAMRDARSDAREDRNFARKEKQDEKMEGLKTPYGLANTVDDAKQLKEAHESKKNFDSKIQEMIDLRNKYGAESWNSEAIARGKQLSKDLLLEYKNMAKLGVLSKSDEDIINKIIPEDPLAFKFASLKGQDPILTQLQKFKGDSDKDFATRIATRTRQGLKDYADGNGPMTASQPAETLNPDEAAAKRQKRIAELLSKQAAGMASN